MSWHLSRHLNWLVNTMLLALMAPLLLLQPPLASSSSDLVTSGGCTARWSVLSQQQNGLTATADLQVRLGYMRGPKDSVTADSSSSDSQSDSSSDSQSDSRSKTLVGLTVRLRSAAPAAQQQHHQLTVQLTGAQLIRPAERHLTVTVSPGGAVTVWQLVAAVDTGDSSDQQQQLRQFGFENTAITTGGLEPPGRVVDCSASYRTRRLIQADTLVRLRHAPTGNYLVMRPKRGWEAAELGHSRQFRYRLIGVGSGDGGVRIEAETHTYGGYKFAYASLRGGVFFDVRRPGSGAQRWTLSNPYPRDGDSVAIRNVRWPAAALTIRGEGGGGVRCANTRSPDKWILEIAGVA